MEYLEIPDKQLALHSWGVSCLVREPPRYTRRKSPVDAEERAKESKPYPFRKDLLWKTTMAVLTDRDPGFRPEPYREGGKAEDSHRLCYHYKAFKVLDQSEEELELAHWLKGKSTSEAQTQTLLSFLKYYRPLEDKALENKFNEQLKERSKTMGTVEYLVNEAKEKGRCEGREEGREEEKLSFVRSLLENTDFDDEKIATLAAVDVDFVNKYWQADRC